MRASHPIVASGGFALGQTARRCAECGCTDARGCERGWFWSGPDLCSICAGFAGYNMPAAFVVIAITGRRPRATAPLRADTRLSEDLGFDDHETIDLAEDIERALGMALAKPLLCNTVGELVQLVDRRLKAGAAT